MSIQRYHWGIIGCGDVCEVKSAPAYPLVSGFSITAVMSRNLAKAQDFATRHHIPKFYDNAQQLIQDPAINAIYIATPPDSHCEYALQVAAAGKVCCVEKPMALDVAQCKEMEQAFAARNLPLFVAYYRRSMAGFKQIKYWLDSGEIGTVRHIDWQYMRPPSAIDKAGKVNWRTDKTIAKAGYFEDIASHGLDLMVYLLGNVTVAQGVASNQQQLYTAYDAVAASLLFESGVTGTGCWNFAASSHIDEVRISGEDGEIRFSVFADTPAILTSHSTSITQAMTKPSPIQQEFVQAMADHLAGTQVHPSMAASALHTNWIMQCILQ